MNIDDTWLERVRTEHKDLSTKLDKLDAYLCSTLEENQIGRELLVVQASIMEAYKTVLEARILAALKHNI